MDYDEYVDSWRRLFGNVSKVEVARYAGGIPVGGTLTISLLPRYAYEVFGLTETEHYALRGGREPVTYQGELPFSDFDGEG